jgi:dTDP-4-dehydrorhamnose reductase
VPLFTDQWVTPTRAGEAAETILDLVEADASGLFHVASSSCVTPYEFGAMFAETLDYNSSLLDEGSINDVDRVAKRPRNICLGTKKVESLLNRSVPTLSQDLLAVSDLV